jgi:ribosome maturation factor RimP
MIDIVELTTPLVEQVCRDIGVELLDIKYVPGRRRGKLCLTIDKESGSISIDECEAVSRRLSRLLDVEDPIPGAYQLEVSSPGFKRILRVPKDLPRFTGHRVRVKLTENIRAQKVWNGVLIDVADPLHLETEIGTLEIPLRLIHKANLDD